MKHRRGIAALLCYHTAGESSAALVAKSAFTKPTLVSVCVTSRGQEYTATFASSTLFISPSTIRLKTIPLTMDDELVPQP